MNGQTLGVNPGGFTTLELAARLGRTVEWTETLLRESERDGIVELDGDTWKLTAWANRAFGQALAYFAPLEDAA